MPDLVSRATQSGQHVGYQSHLISGQNVTTVGIQSMQVSHGAHSKSHGTAEMTSLTFDLQHTTANAAKQLILLP